MDIIALPLYLAPVSLYARLYAARKMFIDYDTCFVKQTYRSRTVIAAENGALSLTVPVIHNGNRQSMRDVRISEHGNWRHMHWNALTSAYKKSPFFDYYADDFRPFYEKRYDFLVDFNMELHKTVCELLGLEREVLVFDKTDNPEPVQDIRHFAEPATMSHAGFAPLRYYQVFERRNGFLPNLSIADLLFNMGPEGLIVLKNSVSPL